MKNNVALKLVPCPADEGSPVGDRRPHACVGAVVAVNESSVPLVDYPGNKNGPLCARLALSLADAERLAKAWQSSQVLLVFVNGDERLPVITGLVQESFDDPAYQVADWEGFRQLFLRAEEELVLQCGDAKIVLRRDGKLTIVGKEILSRAVERHRIRGATVDIN